MAVDWQARMKKTCEYCVFCFSWNCDCGQVHIRHCHYDDRIKMEDGETSWPSVGACYRCDKFQPKEKT